MTRMTPLTEPRLTGDTVLRVDRMLAETYTRSGEWRAGTLADTIRQLAAVRPDDLAFREGEHDLSWAAYDEYTVKTCAEQFQYKEVLFEQIAPAVRPCLSPTSCGDP